jgi:cell division protease FtsH
MARRMVTEYGMSKRIGPVAMGHKEELVFLGRDIGEQKNYSEKSAEAIDDEIRTLIGTAYNRAKEILLANREILDRLARALMRDETIEGEALEKCFNASADELEPALAPTAASTLLPAAEPTSA